MSGTASALRDWSLRHLARPGSGRQFVPQIDGLRCVAIVAVILYHMHGYVAHAVGEAHAQTFLHRLLAQGFFGVPLFFALSGYIISAPFLGPTPPRWRAYMLRRLTRLEPPYFINLLFVFALQIVVLGVAFDAQLPHLLASMVYLHNPIYGQMSAVNGVAWSLEVEWQFYLLAPLSMALLARFARGRGVLLLCAILLGGLAYLPGARIDAMAHVGLLKYFGFFVAGIWVATCEAQAPREAGRGGHDLLGLVASLAIPFILMFSRPLYGLLPALTAIVLYCALRGPLLKRVLGWWPVHCIGAMCYSIYLYHFYVVSLIGKTVAATIGWGSAADPAMLLMILAGMPLLLAACAVPYLLIERPFMVWRPGKNRLADALSLRRFA